MKATLLFDLVLIAMAALLIGIEHFGYGDAESLVQSELASARLHARVMPVCLPNCQR